MTIKWDVRFLQLAHHVSKWSKDPSTRVGAVIVDEQNRIISVGYNGYPQAVEDTHQRLHDRDVKYKSIIHGEINAILFAQRSLKGTTLYTYPIMPCAGCASIIIQSGIIRVVAPISDNPRWTDSFTISKASFQESHVILDLIDPDLITGITCE